jgi:UrcA family protein
MTKSPTTMLLMAGLLAVTGGSASAEKAVTIIGEAPDTERVQYSAADLANDQAIRGLQRRVRSAAHRVCAPSEDTFMPTYIELRCYGPTAEDALAQVDRAVELSRSKQLVLSGSIAIRAR